MSIPLSILRKCQDMYLLCQKLQRCRRVCKLIYPPSKVELDLMLLKRMRTYILPLFMLCQPYAGVRLCSTSKYGDKNISEKESNLLHVLEPYQKILTCLILKIWALKYKDVRILRLTLSVFFLL
jgi:hypothetical protein